MKQKTKKEMFLDATMRIVAKNGLLSFSMRQVTNETGTSEALIYRHYTTKENLLFQCFQSVDQQIASLFTDEKMPVIHSEKELYEYIRSLWMKYFTFLVQNDYKTLYYFEYRDSPYIANVLEHETLSAHTYFKGFVDIFKAISQEHHSLNEINENYLWTYILDVTGLFAKRVIRGELPKDKGSYENVWRLIHSGLSCLL